MKRNIRKLVLTEKTEIPQKKKHTGLIIAIIIIALFVIPIILISLLFLVLGIAALAGSSDLGTGNVALIPVEGVIMTESSGSLFGEQTLSSAEIVSLIEKADNNPQIKAILFEINSPGGSPVASDEIGTAIKKANKTTVALIRDIGTSGAYWVASSCDYVIANRMSLTGSIGVYSSYLEFSGLMRDYNVTYERLVAGEYKDMGVPYRQLTDKERKLLQAQLDKLHSYFIQEVADNRGLSYDYVKSLSTGMAYLGSEAKTSGLIDELGGKAEAEAFIKRKTDLTEVSYVVYRSQPSLLDSLGSILSNNPLALSYTDIRFLSPNTPYQLK